MRQIPSVDELLARPRLAQLAQRTERELVVDATRAVLASLRKELEHGGGGGPDVNAEEIETRVAVEVEGILAPSLVPVINATGVILHTNLGRAPLAAGAAHHAAEAASQYSNLEFDLVTGTRGKRDAHTSERLARLAGAESAIVVNNNAAAVFLVLHTLARGDEVVVSRGELVEIGDGFRIPDIMAQSGAALREVGTTNRTRLADYEGAIGDRTRLLMRVHRSNFRLEGFTEQPSLGELVELGQRFTLPVYEDLGSGCAADLSAAGIGEPLARASLEAGVSLVSFSGDKLLGGPQAGIIAGKKELVSRLRRNPLFRALRVDKLTIGALEWTLTAYLRGALDEIPALAMIRLPIKEIERRAQKLIEEIRRAGMHEAEVSHLPGFSVIGGGSTPEQRLPTRLVAIHSRKHSAAELLERLRRPAEGMPVIARIEDERLVADLRTVFPEQDAGLAGAIVRALA